MSSLPVAPERRRSRPIPRCALAFSVAGIVSAPSLAAAQTFDRPIPLGPTYHLFSGIAVGRGLRFDNPYRLPTELGSDAQSLSLTANYLDLSFGATVGNGRALSHGMVLHGSFALDGVPQEVVTPSYLLWWRIVPRFATTFRAGIPIVVEPDFNAGFEAAAQGIFWITSAIGVTVSTVGSLFYGAATLDTPRTAIPILSLEAGAIYDFEVLP
jgi:hypothetical protein